jgi:hypothetical protein
VSPDLEGQVTDGGRMATSSLPLDYACGVPAAAVTLKNPDDDGWVIDDPVIELRLRGGAYAYPLPPCAPGTALVVGAAETCDIQLRDPTGCVSRHHADLIREPARSRDAWILHDHGSTNGIRQDGERRLSIELAPGVEITIGGVNLIAESPRLKELRAFLARVIGWDQSRISDVDSGIQAVRTMAMRRAALVLCGDGHLEGIARRLHDLALGRDQPFTFYSRRDIAKLDPARSGTYCFLDDQLPDDFSDLAAALATRESKARVVVCSPSRDDATEAMSQLGRSTVLELPGLESRPFEVERLILEYAAEAMATLDAPSIGFREHEFVWLKDLRFASLDEIQDTTYRLVALRNWSVRGGAQRLGISHVALSRWARRRRIPT